MIWPPLRIQVAHSLIENISPHLSPSWPLYDSWFWTSLPLRTSSLYVSIPVRNLEFQSVTSFFSTPAKVSPIVPITLDVPIMLALCTSQSQGIVCRTFAAVPPWKELPFSDRETKTVHSTQGVGSLRPCMNVCFLNHPAVFTYLLSSTGVHKNANTHRFSQQ